MQSSSAVPPICTPSGKYVKKFPSKTGILNNDTIIAAPKNTKNIGNDHFCSLSNCLMPNQFSGMTIDPKMIIYTQIGIEGKNSCTAYTRIIPSKAQYIIKFDAYISEVSDAPI